MLSINLMSSTTTTTAAAAATTTTTTTTTTALLLMLCVWQEFGGNSDKNIERFHFLNSPFVARFVRIYPVAWSNKICLRAGLLGCPYTGQYIIIIIIIIGDYWMQDSESSISRS